MARASLIPAGRVFQAFERSLTILNLPRRLEGIQARRGGTSTFVVLRQIVAGLLNQATSLRRGVDRCRNLVRTVAGEDTVYRFLASRSIELWKLLPRLSSRDNTYEDDLLIIDDTPIAKPRSRKLAGLSFHYSTTARKVVHGLCMVGLYHLGASLRGFIGMRTKIGSSSIPGTGRRGRPTKSEQESRDLTKPELALAMIQEAREAGNRARRVVFDSAYFGRPFLLGLKRLRLHGYTRAKANSVFWIDEVKWKALDWAKAMTSWKTYRNTEIRYAAAIAKWEGYGWVRLVRAQYLPTGEKRTHYAVLVCTDLNASGADIIRATLDRWSIEVEFRNAKTECGLEKVHVRSYHSIANYMVCALLGVRLLRLMEGLLNDAKLAIPRVLESLRLALQGALYELQQSAAWSALETMIPTTSSENRGLKTMIQSRVPLGCGT